MVIEWVFLVWVGNNVFCLGSVGNVVQQQDDEVVCGEEGVDYLLGVDFVFFGVMDVEEYVGLLCGVCDCSLLNCDGWFGGYCVGICIYLEDVFGIGCDDFCWCGFGIICVLCCYLFVFLCLWCLVVLLMVINLVIIVIWGCGEVWIVLF